MTCCCAEKPNNGKQVNHDVPTSLINIYLIVADSLAIKIYIFNTMTLIYKWLSSQMVLAHEVIVVYIIQTACHNLYARKVKWNNPLYILTYLFINVFW